MNVSVINNVPQELLIADTYKYKASIRRYIEYYISTGRDIQNYGNTWKEISTQILLGGL